MSLDPDNYDVPSGRKQGFGERKARMEAIPANRLIRYAKCLNPSQFIFAVVKVNNTHIFQRFVQLCLYVRRHATLCNARIALHHKKRRILKFFSKIIFLIFLLNFLFIFQKNIFDEIFS